jgi:hypothetical protein
MKEKNSNAKAEKLDSSVCVLHGNGRHQGMAIIATLIALLASVALPIGATEISLTGTTASENFDGMETSSSAILPSGWVMSPAGAAMPTYSAEGNFTAVNQAASSGSPTTGGRYNWGSGGTERSAGFMTSGGYASPNSIMVGYVNDTGSTIAGVTLAFDYERYRINSAAAAITFFYSTDGSNWTSVAAGDSGAYSTGTSSYGWPIDTINKAGVSVTGLNIAVGEKIYFRWNFNTSGANSQGLSLDNFSMVATLASSTGRILVTLPGQTFTSGSGNSGTPTAQTAGSAFNLTLTAVESDAVTIDTSYSGTKTISYSGPGGSPSYTTSVTFTSGQATDVATTLYWAETTTLTATDGTLIGVASSSLTVNPGAIASYTVSASSPQVVGMPFNVIVTARDAYDNVVTTDSSTQVTMASSSGNVQFDSNGDGTFDDNAKTLANGTFTISAKNEATETASITATDANSKTGSSPAIVFAPPALYRSKSTGNWNATSTWEQSIDYGTTWVDATVTPASSTAETITIRNGHTVTISASDLTIDQVTVDAGGQVTVASGITSTLANGAGTDLIINGTWLNSGGTWTISSGAAWSVGPGGTYVHNTSSGIATPLNAASFDAGSTMTYRGSSSLTPAVAVAGRTFANLVFESTSGLLSLSSSGSTILTIDGNLSVGASGGGTVSYSLSAFSGPIPIAGNLSVGNSSTLTIGGSAVTLAGNLVNEGTLSLSSSGGSFTFDGTTTISGGSATTFANGFTINGGKSVALSQSIVIPDGKTGTVNGTLDLGTSAVTGPGTLTIGSGGLLKGNGTVTGEVLVSDGGILAPGASIGTLTFASTPTLSGTVLMEIDRNATPNADKLVRTGGGLTYGGTLTVANIGATLTGGEVFDLFDADSFSGAFAVTNLPALGSGLNWYAGNLAVDGSLLVNRKPVAAAGKSLSTRTNVPVAISAAKLMFGSTDPDLQTLTVVSVGNATPDGSSVTLADGIITYTPKPGSTESAGFDYTVSDGHGGTDTASVTVTVTGDGGGASPNVVYGPTIDGDQFVVRFAGIPGEEYTIEHAEDVNGPWSWKANSTAPADNEAGFGIGVFEFRDTMSSSGYYRTVWPAYTQPE